jgi:hypothetical protein
VDPEQEKAESTNDRYGGVHQLPLVPSFFDGTFRDWCPRTTGIQLWSSAHKSFGVVVMIAKLRTLSPAGERHVSHKPAKAISPRSVSAIA